MSEISESKWRDALTSILEDLEEQQYNKMLENLLGIPRSRKTEKPKEKMPGVILEHYGLHKSIRVIDDVMKTIPRKDAAVQDALRPFVDQLEKVQERKSRGDKRKRDIVEDNEEEAALEASNENIEPVKKPEKSDPLVSCPPEQEGKAHPWKITIQELKFRGQLHEIEGFFGKVVKKSGLRPYVTNDKKSFFSYLGVADETASAKVKVYSKKCYREIQEDHSYLFRRLIKDREVVMVTSSSKVSETRRVQIPQDVEEEARKLIYPESPFVSITDAKSCPKETLVSLEGTVEEIDPPERVTVRFQKEKREKQRFKLKDETDSIWIFMWGEETQQIKSLSVGDAIKITNIKTNHYYDNCSLKSTGYTKVHKVKSVGVQQENIEIIGIIKANKKEIHLEAEFTETVHTFVVTSKLLAKEFGLKLDDDFKESLLEKLPFRAEAEIRGNKIKKIKAV